MGKGIAGAKVLIVIIFVFALSSTPAQVPAPAGIEQRVVDILGRMTIEEKVDMLSGVDGFYVRAVPRLNLPRLKMSDGPIGVRNYGPATAMAAGIALAATWNPELAERIGIEIGRDARARGVHFLLGPGANIYRAPMNGRNFEYLGEDPFLGARIVTGFIKGVQSQGVSATVKHYMGNNSEFLRHDSDSVIDERALREIYLPIFEAAVKDARVGAIMNSYNLTNGIHMTQNGYLNTEIAKKEWGFTGIMMSDWGSTYDGIAAANNGLDLEMPAGAFMNRKILLPAIASGQVSPATIDDKIRRILRTSIRFGWLDRNQEDNTIPSYNMQADQAALEGAREGTVLLKNDSGLLPLSRSKIHALALVGPVAYPADPVGGGSARVVPYAPVSMLQGLSAALGTAADVLYDSGIPTVRELAAATNFLTGTPADPPGLKGEYFVNPDLQGTPLLVRTDRHINFGRAPDPALPTDSQSQRWTGYYAPQNSGLHDLFVGTTGEDGGSYRLWVDDKLLLDNWTIHKALIDCASLALDAKTHKIVLEHRGRSQWLGSRLNLGIVRRGEYVNPRAKALAAKADGVIVAAGFDPENESEAADRTFRLPPGQDELIREMAAANKNTVVVLTSGGSVDAEAWIDRIPALLEVWYPGQAGGRALAEILFGDVNPSGRLPISWERRWEDNPVHDSYYPEAGSNRIIYKEGVFVGYRGYEHAGVRPLFPFGFGLSYTTFGYRNLKIALPVGNHATGASWSAGVTFDVTNTGKRSGSEVAEIYVGDVHPKLPRPAKELKGFTKIALKPGETRHVSVNLDRRAFCYYDVATRQWRLDPGKFDLLVGRSADRIELRGTVEISAP
jgi:beta-glucosidase